MLHLLLQMIITNLRVMPANERVDAVLRATDAQRHLLWSRPYAKALRRLVQTKRLARLAPAPAHAAQRDGEGYHLDKRCMSGRERQKENHYSVTGHEVR